jgi:hypothetical protein
MTASRIDEIVSLVVASLFFSMWQSCVCHEGEIAMIQTHRVFDRKPGNEIRRQDHGVSEKGVRRLRQSSASSRASANKENVWVLSHEIPPTRHPGMLLAGVQDLKELDSSQSLSRQALGREHAGMTKAGFHPSL